MATHQVEFSSRQSGYYSDTFYVRLTFTDEYVQSGNYFKVTLTNVEFKTAARDFSSQSFVGKVLLNYSVCADYEGGFAGGYVNTSYHACPYEGSFGTVNKAAGSGTVTLHVEIDKGDTGSRFGFWYEGTNWGVLPQSTDVTLSIPTSVLTVDPAGGTWEGSDQPQTFTQQTGTTKAIADPTRSGYTFTGWTLTGSGSFSNGVYTFGAGSGTLTAGWALASYTVSVTAGDNIASVSGGGSKQYGEQVTVSAVLGSATGYTYQFDGWYAGSTKEYFTVSKIFSISLYLIYHSSLLYNT